MNSPEFKAELQKTWKFVKKVTSRDLGLFNTHKMM